MERRAWGISYAVAMKLLLISPRYRGGGAERNARDLFERLPPRGIEPAMFTADRSPGDPPAVHGVRLGWEKYLRALEWVLPPQDWRYLGSRRALGRLRPGDFDLVHFHNLHGGWMSAGAARRLARRLPTVLTMHDAWAATGGLPHDLARVFSYDEFRRRYGDPDTPLHSEQPLSQKVMRHLRGRMPRPSLVICPSRYLADIAAASPLLAGAPVRQIPYPLTMLQRDLDAPRDKAKTAFGIAPDRRVILIVAAWFTSVYKGMPLALEMLRQMKPGEAEVLALGDSATQFLKDLPVRVTAPGQIADEDKLALAYRAADVTLSPSVADSFPFVALESFACRTPLACFKVGGLTELAGDGERGLSAEPFDVAQLLANVRRLLADADLNRRLGENGRRWVEANCGVEGVIDRTVEAYREAVEVFREAAAGRAGTGAARGRAPLPAVAGADN